MNRFLINWINQTYFDIVEKEKYLNELDFNVGDGDHGTAILKGIHSVKKILDIDDFKFDSNTFNLIAKTMRLEMGGASGILTSIFFEELSNLKLNKNEVSLIPIFENTVLKIKKRGKVEPGDKSLLDVYNGVYLYLKQNSDIINIFDVIILIEFIIDGNDYLYSADLNQDGSINVSDVVALVNLILEL